MTLRLTATAGGLALLCACWRAARERARETGRRRWTSCRRAPPCSSRTPARPAAPRRWPARPQTRWAPAAGRARRGAGPARLAAARLRTRVRGQHYGEGDPPDAAAAFASLMQTGRRGAAIRACTSCWRWRQRIRAVCGFGRALDEWLRAQGAQPLVARRRLDVRVAALGARLAGAATNACCSWPAPTAKAIRPTPPPPSPA